MSQIACDLARHLAGTGIDVSALAAAVSDTAAARSEAISREGLRAQIEYLHEAYGPDEIGSLALGNGLREAVP